jgi:hypothetical protein
MLTRFALCSTLTIALLALPASALAADVVVPSRVAASTTVPAGGSRTLTLRCPATAVALNAAVTRRGAGVTVRRSIPGTGSGDWRFRLSAAAGARRRGVRAALRCVRLALPAGISKTRLVVSTRRISAITVPAGSSTGLDVRCARGFIATGYGLDRTTGDVTLAGAEPRPRGWDFRVENTGTSAANARLSVRCLKQRVQGRDAGGATELNFAVRRRVFSDAITRKPPPRSRGTFTHTCAESQFSIATGHALDAADGAVVTGTGPDGLRAGRWTFRGARPGETMTTFLLCLSRHTPFG